MQSIYDVDSSVLSALDNCSEELTALWKLQMLSKDSDDGALTEQSKFYQFLDEKYEKVVASMKSNL